MSHEELKVLTDRLAIVERELKTATAELSRLRRCGAAEPTRRAIGIAAMAAAGAIVSAVWSSNMHAQQSADQLTVRSLKVVDINGKRIMEVNDGMNGRGIVLFDGQDQYAGEFRVAGKVENGGTFAIGRPGVGGAVQIVADRTPRFTLYGTGSNPLQIDENGAYFNVAALKVAAPGSKNTTLEIASGKTTMTGLVTVRDTASQPVVTVDPGAIRGLSVFNPRGFVAAQVASVGDTAFLVARDGTSKSPTGKSSTIWMGERGGGMDIRDRNGNPIVVAQDREFVRDTDGRVLQDQAGQLVTKPRGIIVMNERGDEVSMLNVDDNGNGRVKVQGPGGKNGVAAGLLITKEGSILALADSSGKLTAEASSAFGFGSYNKSGQRVAEFGTTESGSNGHLWLGDEGGHGIVEAGMLGDGRGTVRVGPQFGFSGSMGLPSFIVGHK